MASPNNLKFYIAGAWVDPVERRPFDVINPATEQPVAQISLGGAADVELRRRGGRHPLALEERLTRRERRSPLAITSLRRDRRGRLASATAMVGTEVAG